ncbi:MAG: hypothetical protein WBQ75_07615 [Acetobacteraceae bacterium]
MTTRDPHLIAARIIRDAGGELVGRTRLQKVAYLTQLAGFANDFRFEYRHYGPFSEDLARGMEIASAFGDVQEVERQADWGGRYSIYRTSGSPEPEAQERAGFVQRAKQIGAIELELAATAAFLAQQEGVSDPWAETARRKPEKAAHGRLEGARDAYARLRAETGNRLPLLPQA